jgi:hypothetical protein
LGVCLASRAHRRWPTPSTAGRLSTRCRSRSELLALRDLPSGTRYVAFFGAMYYAALRPEEAVNLRKHNLSLPRIGWGELILDEATPDTGGRWTDSGERRDTRQLKHRGRPFDSCRHPGRTRPAGQWDRELERAGQVGQPCPGLSHHVCAGQRGWWDSGTGGTAPACPACPTGPGMLQQLWARACTRRPPPWARRTPAALREIAPHGRP